MMKQSHADALWNHLHWLRVLAEKGSFTRAAEQLEVSKAAMSQKIKELEAIAGVALVQRTTRSVRLTHEGQKLVEDIRQPFDQIEQSFNALRDASGPLRGVVRVTAPVAFARQQLLVHIRSFLQQYPEVRIQLEVSDQLVSLSSEGYDLAVRHSHRLPETHVVLPLCDTRTLLVASPEYLARQGVPDDPCQLAEHSCLYYPRGNERPQWRLSHPQTGETRSVAVKGGFATNNSESIRDAAISGLGIAMLPDFSARAALENGELIPVLDEWQVVGGFADKIWLVRPYAAQVPRAVTVFSHWLREGFQNSR